MHINEVPIDKRLIAIIQRHGIETLFPPQVTAFKTRVLEGQNLVLAIPTSAGKTLVSEVSMLKAISEGRGKALYLAPLRSLAREKYVEFKKYSSLGVVASLSIGDYDSTSTEFADSDIIVLTTERADSLIRHSPPWLSSVSVVVVDEVHLVNDEHRGPTLEMVLAKIRQLLPSVQIIALSATISNADEIAQWLDAELVKSEWRPVPLAEGVLLDGVIHFADGSSTTIDCRYSNPVKDLVADTLRDQGQVLVFVSSRRSTVAVGKTLTRVVRATLDAETLQKLDTVAKRIARTPSAPEASRILSELVKSGVAFHHAGLTNRERSLVEDSFKQNLLKVIVATPTLAAGVNLPARRTIIRDYRRYESSRGNYPIPVLEYKQMAGRAGRPKYDDHGEAILVAKSFEERDMLLDNYVLAEPEAIKSKLAAPSALQFHLLASIATGVTLTREGIDRLISATFFGQQFSLSTITQQIDHALEFLQAGDLITFDSLGAYAPTAFGSRVSRLYISPKTAILFRDVLSVLESSETPSLLGLLHLICHSPDQPVTYVQRRELEDYDYFVEEHIDDLLIDSPDTWDEPNEYVSFLGEIKTARILLDWISERGEREITERYGIGMGDVHRFIQTAEWLAYSASEIARVCGANHYIAPLKELQTRLKHGVKQDIIELVNLKGIGRVRGRMLYQYGFKTIDDLYAGRIEEIARVPTIGDTVASAIKAQLGDGIASDASVDEVLIDDDTPIQMLLDDFEPDSK
ncbi:MAG: DEAD/DEAH box helicase [Candidatus Thorarchaeota archaeon]|nr:DEAD/DEAH box helicase [Candidatus Thorarchaeota archaeon]